MTAETKITLVGWGKIVGVFLPMVVLFGGLAFKAGAHSERLDTIEVKLESAEECHNDIRAATERAAGKFEKRFLSRMDRMEDQVRTEISSIREMLQDHLQHDAKANGGGK